LGSMGNIAIRANSFAEWLSEAQRGDSYIYHVGLIANDREVALSEGNSKLSRDERKRVWREARDAWMAYEGRQVCLTQRRVSEGVYEYRATRR